MMVKMILNKNLLFVVLSFISLSCGDPRIYFAGSGVAFNYNPSVGPGFDSNPPTGPVTHHYIRIPGIDLSSYPEFTVEFWCLWIGSYGGQYAFANQLQTAFFYGNSYQYFGIHPSNGTFAGPDSTLPFSAVRVGGVYKSNFEVNNLEAEGAWVHFAVSVRQGVNANSSITLYSSYDEIEKTTVGSLEGAFTTINGSTIFLGKGNSSDTFPYPGQMDNLRIWSKYKEPSEIRKDRGVDFNGDEPNLIADFKFDEGNGSVTVDSTSNKFIGTFGAASTNSSPRWTDQEFAFRSISYIPITSGKRSAAYNKIQTTKFFYGSDSTTNAIYGARLSDYPTDAKLCLGAATLSPYVCNQILNDKNATITIPVKYFNVTMLPTRSSCNSVQNYAIYVWYSFPPYTTNINSIPMSMNVTFGGISPNISTTNTLSTEGGVITIDGSNFGLDGDIHSSESIYTYLNGDSSNSTRIPCTFPIVSQSGSKITCNVTEGTGVRDIVITFCRNSYIFRNAFAYQKPTITSVKELSTISIRITGYNFGPIRTPLRNSTADVIMINGTKCYINSMNQTSIECTMMSNFTSNSNYSISLWVGGQLSNFSFEFKLCTQPCQNGGLCVGANTCDCSLTGFNGTLCTEELPCFPKCVNNGTCVFSNIGNSSGLYCKCNEGWTGRICSEPVIPPKNETETSPPPQNRSGVKVPVIVGASAGALIIIVGLVVVVIVLARRKSSDKRGTTNFIPLEKKDFEKLIYGEQLHQSPEKDAGDIRKLEDLLVHDSSLELAFTISNLTQITEADKIAKALVVVFQDNDRVLPLLEAFINDEVKNSEQAGTLFRSNSMVSKMFKFYSRLIGLPYLYITVGPEMDELIAEELGLEVDPEKMEDGTDLDEMRWTLMAQSQKILKSILNSVEDCPTQFRHIFAHIKKAVGERFPANVNTTIGGFIFLRFFCPAVSSPEAYGIVEEPPSASARRLLILITKVLQNLSNDVEFGSKEPYMTKMNDFIQSNRVKLSQFYDKLIKPSPKSPVAVNLPKNIKAVSLSVLALHIRENLNKIENQELRKKLQPIVSEE